jgi:hypothetical protein
LVYFLIRATILALQGKKELSKAIIDAIIWNIKNWRDYV